jgi:four helix bundle protein
VWERAAALVELCARQPPADAELRQQTMRAVKSVALNVAEGAALAGRARARFFRTARASLVEVTAAYELAELLGEAVPTSEVAELADHIYAMLTKLLR